MAERRVGWIVKLLVALHLAAITIWALPSEPGRVMREEVRPVGTDWILLLNYKHLKKSSPVQLYLFTTGFWQYWDMFAPDPVQTDMWADAIITYRDGRQRRYQYPRIYLLDLPSKYVKERYRKFYERAGGRNATYLWRPFAERIARLNDDIPGNPPVEVLLRKHVQHIAPPGKPPNLAYTTEGYYLHVVDQAALARAREQSR